MSLIDADNLPFRRASFNLLSQTTCPIVSGEVGLWFDGYVVRVRNADGTDSEIPVATASYSPVRLLDTSVLVSSTYDYSTTALTWTHKTNNTQATIDSVAPGLGDRVLRVVGDAQDGIYSYTRLKGSSIKAQWTRVADMNASAAFVNGATVGVSAGTVYANTLWELSFTAPITMDTDTPVFTQTATAVTATAIRAAISATQAGGTGASGSTAPAFTGTAATAAVNIASPAFSGTGMTASGQNMTSTDTQTMTLNQCAGMWLVCATHGPYLIASNTAVTGAVAVLTIYGGAPTTDAGTYKIISGMTPAGSVASHTHTGPSHTHTL
jgi:hypothetical protein